MAHSATRFAITAVIGLAVVSACSASDDSADPTGLNPSTDGPEDAASVTSRSASPDQSVTSSPEPSDVTTPGTTADVPETSPTATPSTTAVATTATTVPPTTPPGPAPFDELEVVVYPVPDGSRPHDVAPAADGGVWYTAQRAGALGYLDPATGETRHIALGDGSAPHGVITDDQGVAWVTDGGLNAIVRVDPNDAEAVAVYPLPDHAPDANLNTAAFAGDGRLWFTGQGGFHGVVDPDTGAVAAWESPRGRGPYGITATPDGEIYYASLAGSYVGAVASDGEVTVLEPPTPAQGARRVWSDSTGSVWVSEWNSGQLSRYSPATGEWHEWPLPGAQPATYAVFVDEVDQVWVSDFGGNAIHRFDPGTESFETVPLPAQSGEVRQIHGRGDEVWAAQSADDSLIVIRPTS